MLERAHPAATPARKMNDQRKPFAMRCAVEALRR
jgi:hypothetical protein